MTLTGTGSYDPTTDILQVASSGSLGSFSWTTGGTGAITFSGTELDVTTDINFLNGDGEKSFDTHAEGFVRDDGTTGGFGYDTDKNGDEIPGTIRVFKDDRQIVSGNWTYDGTSGLAFAISSVGVNGSDGGSGTSTTIIAPIPEPSTLLLIGSGVAGLFVSMRIQRARRIPDGSLQ